MPSFSSSVIAAIRRPICPLLTESVSRPTIAGPGNAAAAGDGTAVAKQVTAAATTTMTARWLPREWIRMTSSLPGNGVEPLDRDRPRGFGVGPRSGQPTGSRARSGTFPDDASDLRWLDTRATRQSGYRHHPAPHGHRKPMHPRWFLRPAQILRPTGRSRDASIGRLSCSRCRLNHHRATSRLEVAFKAGMSATGCVSSPLAFSVNSGACTTVPSLPRFSAAPPPDLSAGLRLGFHIWVSMLSTLPLYAFRLR